METWLTGDISDKNIVGDVTPAGYSYHHVACTHRKGWRNWPTSLKFEKHSRYQARSFENYQLTFMFRDVNLRVAIIYRPHPNKENGTMAEDCFQIIL